MAKTAPLAAGTVIHNTGSYTPDLTVTGSGGSGGAGQMIYTNDTSTSVLSLLKKEAIRISGNGDIFHGKSKHDNDGVFARLARLERLMGIMQRDRDLESDYEPMRELGDAYDVAVDAAIESIMDAALNKLKHIEDKYKNMRPQAEMWRALTKDTN